MPPPAPLTACDLQYLVAAVSFLIGARLSDHYKTRSIPLLVYGAIMIVGCERFSPTAPVILTSLPLVDIIIAAVTSPGVRYFGVFVTGKTFRPSP